MFIRVKLSSVSCTQCFVDNTTRYFGIFVKHVDCQDLSLRIPFLCSALKTLLLNAPVYNAVILFIFWIQKFSLATVVVWPCLYTDWFKISPRDFRSQIMQFNEACILFFQNRKALRKENVNFFDLRKLLKTFYPRAIHMTRKLSHRFVLNQLNDVCNNN